MPKRRKIRRTKRPAKPKRIRVKRTKPSLPRRRIRVKRAKRAPKRDVRKRIIKLLRGKRKAPRKIRIKPFRTRVTKGKRGKPTRVSIVRAPKRRKPIKRLPPPQKPKEPPKSARPQEWLVTFEYKASGKSVDLIVVAFTDEQAADFAIAYLMETPDGAKMVKHFAMTVIPFKPPRYRNVADVSEVEER